jgi:ADP-heptose:LPS heptosyltransferase
LERYLVARTDRIGDLILALPVAQAIKESRPAAEVHYLVSPLTSEIACACPFVDGVIEYDEERKDVGGFRDLIDSLRPLEVNTAIVLRPTLRVAAACLLAGVPQRVGTAYRYYSLLFTHRVREHRRFAAKPEFEFNLNILRATLDIGDRDYRPRIEPDENAARYAEKALAENSLGEKDFVIIHPGSRGSARNLPLGTYAEIADLIEDRFATGVLVTAGRDEIAIVEEMDRLRSGKSLRLTEIPRLLDLAAVIGKSRLFISGSTGPMHIAAAVGTPTLSFFSPVRSCSPRRWGPVGNRNTVLMPPVPECPTCKGPACEYFDCMERIEADKITESLEALLSAGTG